MQPFDVCTLSNSHQQRDPYLSSQRHRNRSLLSNMRSAMLQAIGIICGFAISLIRGQNAPCGTAGYTVGGYYSNPGQVCSADYTGCSGAGATTTTALSCVGAGSVASTDTAIMRFSDLNQTCLDRRIIPQCADVPNRFGYIVKLYDGYRFLPTTNVYGLLKMVTVTPPETIMKCVVECYAIANCFAFNWRSDVQKCELVNYLYTDYFAAYVTYEADAFSSWYERQL